MGRLASLIGVLDSGEVIPLAQGEAQKVIEAYKELVKAGGAVKSGAKEVKLSEMRCLSTNTAGGELKPRYRFNDASVSGTMEQEAARKKADAEAAKAAKAKAAAEKKAQDEAEKAKTAEQKEAEKAAKEALKPKPGQKGYKPPKATKAEIAERKRREAVKAARRKAKNGGIDVE